MHEITHCGIIIGVPNFAQQEDMECFCNMILLRDELMDTGVILVEAPRSMLFLPPETFWNFLPEFVHLSAPPEAKMEMVCSATKLAQVPDQKTRLESAASVS